MESYKLGAKFFLDPASMPTPAEFVPVLHGWIQQRLITDHLLIDVADYAHVPEGPSIVLVSHEAIYSIDFTDGRPGLQYFRKQPFDNAHDFPERLRATFRATLQAAALLESDPRLTGRLRFRTDEVAFRIYDRLFAPNEPTVFAELCPQLQAFASELFGNAPVTLHQHGSRRELFEVRIKTPKSEAVSTLLNRLSASTPANV
jgi:hypothetical protein